MLMLVSWNFKPEDREKVYQRYRDNAGKSIPGIEPIGRWHVVGRTGGCAVVKAENEEAIAALALAWNDVTTMTIEPVVTDEEYERAIGMGG